MVAAEPPYEDQTDPLSKSWEVKDLKGWLVARGMRPLKYKKELLEQVQAQMGQPGGRQACLILPEGLQRMQKWQ